MKTFIFVAGLFALTSSAAFGAGEQCGGISGKTCDPKDWCSYSAENACGVADQSGVCKTKPEICPTVFMPVCGCDAVTYSNACNAHANGASVAYVGSCRKADDATCQQVISCGIKDGQPKEYPTPCAAAADGASNILPKTGASCPADR